MHLGEPKLAGKVCFQPIRSAQHLNERLVSGTASSSLYDRKWKRKPPGSLPSRNLSVVLHTLTVRLLTEGKEPKTSDFSAFGERQRVFNINAQIPHGVFDFGVTE